MPLGQLAQPSPRHRPFPEHGLWQKGPDEADGLADLVHLSGWEGHGVSSVLF
jgi:hypothetical protein